MSIVKAADGQQKSNQDVYNTTKKLKEIPMLNMLERIQNHIERRDLFQLLGSIFHILIWLLLALSCLDMVFRTFLS